MARHIHIHLHRATRDNTAHDPKNGQLTSGSGGGGHKEGDRVKVDESYGGKTGHVDSVHNGFVVVKHDDGSKSSYHESNVKPHEDDEDDDR